MFNIIYGASKIVNGVVGSVVAYKVGKETYAATGDKKITACATIGAGMVTKKAMDFCTDFTAGMYCGISQARDIYNSIDDMNVDDVISEAEKYI